MNIGIWILFVIWCLEFGILPVCTCLGDEPQINITSTYADARIFNNNGVDLISQAKYADAAKEFQKALAIDPDFHIARYNLALVYYNEGKTKDAISEFEYLINGSYYFVNARYNLGTIYLREGAIDKAVEQLKVVTEIEPNHAEAHFNLGFIYFKKGLLDEAISEYQKGLQSKPDTVKGHLSLAFVYEKKGQDKEAIDEYQAALRLDPGHQDAKQATGALEAIGRIKEALRHAPKDIGAYIHLGHIYYARGMYQEALENYNKALQFDSGNRIAKTSAQKATVQLLESKGDENYALPDNP